MRVEVFPNGFLKGYNVFTITSLFGEPRGTRKHNGIDIGCPSGTALLSPVDGTIESIKIDKNGFGLYIKIRIQASIDSYLDIIFAHLHKTVDGLYVGKTVNKGSLIAYTGGNNKIDSINAGSSTGAHLHIQINKFGRIPINPLPFLYKTKCITKNTKTVLVNGGVYKEGYQYFLTDDDFESINSTKNVTNKETYWGATENPVDKATSKTSTGIERLAPGIWQIIKLVVDSSVENRQIYDSSISVQSGSLINFFRKICQQPLVEFMGDTFGNQYYWIVRKPPFDREGFSKMIDLTSIELSNDNIISTDLQWNNENIYSWYQLIPYADFFNESDLYTPAVFFPEFASVWGSKPMSIESNYFNFEFSGRFNIDKNKQNNDNIIKNAIADLKFLIESNAYNAFTRKGTITLINGDRRIKRGTVVKHSSGEYFYVDSVVNNFEVSMGQTTRTTVLTVSKGVFPSFINDRMISGNKISYFRIIDFGRNFDINKVTFDNWRSIISKWKVDINVFGFFMSKQQLYWEKINKNKSVINEFNLKEAVITSK